MSVIENTTKPGDFQSHSPTLPNKPRSPAALRSSVEDVGGRARGRVGDDGAAMPGEPHAQHARGRVGDDGGAQTDEPRVGHARGHVGEDGILSGEADGGRARGRVTASHVDVAEMSSERLEARLVDVARHLAAGTFELLVLVGELDARGGWATWGALSCAA